MMVLERAKRAQKHFFYFFLSLGVVSSVGGVTRLRKISDIRNTLERANKSFDIAIENAHNAEAPQSKNTRHFSLKWDLFFDLLLLCQFLTRIES